MFQIVVRQYMVSSDQEQVGQLPFFAYWFSCYICTWLNIGQKEWLWGVNFLGYAKVISYSAVPS